MELIDRLFFPAVLIAGILLWAFAAYDKKLRPGTDLRKR